MATAMIERFEGAHRFLSNFYPAPVTFEGLEFPSVEHAYQAAKATSLTVRARFSTLAVPLLTAGQAKRAGRKVDLRADWEQVKLDIRRQLLRQKCAREPLRAMLLATGEALLVEGNCWHDNFFGVCSCPACGGRGQNWLGRLLMEVRAELCVNTLRSCPT